VVFLWYNEKEVKILAKEKTVKQIGLRVTETLLTRIEERAEEEGRTVSNLVIKAINDYLDNIDEAKKILKK
jgi:predicted DNA-binding protein